VIAGGDYQHPELDGVKLAYTEDGGMTWRPSPLAPQSFFSAIALDPSNSTRIIAVGSTHTGYALDIRDDHWRMFWDTNLNAVAFAGPSVAYAVGPKGTIVRFTLP